MTVYGTLDEDTREEREYPSRCAHDFFSAVVGMSGIVFVVSLIVSIALLVAQTPDPVRIVFAVLFCSSCATLVVAGCANCFCTTCCHRLTKTEQLEAALRAERTEAAFVP